MIFASYNNSATMKNLALLLYPLYCYNLARLFADAAKGRWALIYKPQNFIISVGNH